MENWVYLLGWGPRASRPAGPGDHVVWQYFLPLPVLEAVASLATGLVLQGPAQPVSGTHW